MIKGAVSTEKLYPDIRYFLLLKEMPGCKVGDLVNIDHADGREKLWISGNEPGSINIEMDYDAAIKAPDWFDAVDHERANRIFKNNTIRFFMMEKGMSLEEATKGYERFEAAN